MTVEQRLDRIERALYEIAKTVGSQKAEREVEPPEVAERRENYTLDYLL